MKILFLYIVTENLECGSKRYSPIVATKNGSWIDLNSNEIMNLERDGMWMPGQPNGQKLQNCTAFRVENSKLVDIDCSWPSCSICSWTNEPIFHLRGLCVNSLIDNLFALVPSVNYNENILFYGPVRTNILFSQKMSSWVIAEDLLKDLKNSTHTKEPSKILGMFKPDKNTNQLPVGRHLWNITDPNCKGMTFLKLSGVS